MKPDLGTKPIVSKASMSTFRISLRKERISRPTELNVAKYAEFQQTFERCLVYVLGGPETVEPVLQFQHPILGDVGRIRDRWTVWVCGDGVGVAACLLTHPLTGGKIG
jgi:hypothetical protein